MQYQVGSPVQYQFFNSISKSVEQCSGEVKEICSNGTIRIKIYGTTAIDRVFAKDILEVLPQKPRWA